MEEQQLSQIGTNKSDCKFTTRQLKKSLEVETPLPLDLVRLLFRE